MQPLLSFDGLTGLRKKTTSVTWNICLLWFVLIMQVATFVLLLVIIFDIAPIIPDIMKVVRTVDQTLSDVQTMVPEMNGTIWDLNHVLPGIKRTIHYTEAICKHTSGCLGYK